VNRTKNESQHIEHKSISSIKLLMDIPQLDGLVGVAMWIPNWFFELKSPEFFEYSSHFNCQMDVENGCKNGCRNGCRKLM